MSDPNLGKPGGGDLRDTDVGMQSGQVGTVTGTGGTAYRSWAAVLGRNLAPSLNKNVLEVVLEKDIRGSFTVTETECTNLLRRLGLDSRAGVHIEGCQICPNGRGVIFITLKKEVEIGWEKRSGCLH